MWIIHFFTFCGGQLAVVVSFVKSECLFSPYKGSLTSHVKGEKPGCVTRNTSSYYPRISSLVKIFIQALLHFLCLDAAVAAHVIITQFPLHSQKSWKCFKVTSKSNEIHLSKKDEVQPGAKRKMRVSVHMQQVVQNGSRGQQLCFADQSTTWSLETCSSHSMKGHLSYNRMCLHRRRWQGLIIAALQI